MVDWNALSAISTAVSTMVLIAGGTVAIYQLREGRRSSQFDATQRMVQTLLDRDFNRALRYVIDDLPNRLQDEPYRRELSSTRGWDIDPDAHPELIVLVRLEEIGIYLRRRLLADDALLDFNGALILQSWENLIQVVALMRTSHRNPHVWSGAEFLYGRAKRHLGNS